MLLVLVDDLRRGDIADGPADDLALREAEELLEGGVGPLVAAVEILEEGRVGHDVNHDLHEVVHGLVGLVPFRP